jgi:antidote-toxin recognition MazE-like antitoxin
MPSASKPKSPRAKSSRAKPSRFKVREHRERLRRQGLRPIQIWVPDVGAPAFRSAAHRQSLAVAVSSRGRDDQAFIDSISAFDDDMDGDE